MTWLSHHIIFLNNKERNQIDRQEVWNNFLGYFSFQSIKK